MNTCKESDFETSVVQLAKKLSARQRRICVLLIQENTTVTGYIRNVLLEALGVLTIPGAIDPEHQAILELAGAARTNGDGIEPRAAYTLLLSLGVLPDLKIAVDFLTKLVELIDPKDCK